MLFNKIRNSLKWEHAKAILIPTAGPQAAPARSRGRLRAQWHAQWHAQAGTRTLRSPPGAQRPGIEHVGPGFQTAVPSVCGSHVAGGPHRCDIGSALSSEHRPLPGARHPRPVLALFPEVSSETRNDRKDLV